MNIYFVKFAQSDYPMQKTDDTQHLATTKHKSNENLYDRKYQSSLNLETDNWAEKWASALSVAGIPFSCLDNEKYRSFLEKEVGMQCNVCFCK